MQNSWNFTAGAKRWAFWLMVLSTLALLGGACTATIEGVGGPGGGEGAPQGALGPGMTGTLQCQPGFTACGNVCVDLQSASDNCGMCGVACTAPAVCANGNCNTACAEGYTKCGDSCTNLAMDSAHCGSCEKVCEAGVPCYGGVCGCPEGVLFCQGQCYDPKSDAAHCGNCETACAGGQGCVDGVCQCAVGEQLCGTECSNLNTPQHCGSCEKVCNAGEICAAGTCIPGTQPCPNGLTRCGDSCVDLQTASSTCGSCDIKCPAAQACAGGMCGCPSGKAACGTSCVDLSTSSLHCGSCTTTCTAGQSCQAGQCKCAEATNIVCDNACVDPQNNPNYCGNCTTKCMGGLPCTDGVCKCPDGETLCDGACLSTDSTAEHCGGCDMPCPVGESCLAGKCSGAIGDSCSSTLAVGISLTSIAVYQAGKIPIMEEDAAVPEGERPADIIVGKPARIRAFVKLESGWANRTVSARLLLTNGDLTPSYFSKRNVTQGSSENSFATTFNFDVKGEDITATTRYAVEIVECDGTPAGTPGKARFPEADNLELLTRLTGLLKLRFIPLNANGRTAATDTARLDLYKAYMAAMYPTSTVEYTVGNPLNINQTISAQGSGWGEALDQVSNLHESDNAPADVYYYGLFQPSDMIGQFCGGGCVAGIGYVAGSSNNARHQRASLGLSYGNASSARTLAHEIGHNHGRPHAPCGGAAGPDQNYPSDAAHAGAKIGWWGFEQPEKLHDPAVATDIMGYCNNQWVSEYTYGLMANRIALLNGNMRVLPSTEPMQHFLFLLTDVTGPRWGAYRPNARHPSGEPELADILDAAGSVITQVTVYRTPTDHLGGALLLVPDPEPGWHAIQIQGEVPLAFGASGQSQP
jgi:hypothetical protein